MVKSSECGEINPEKTTDCIECGEKLNKNCNVELPKSNEDLKKIGYILAIIGPLLLCAGTPFAIIVGIVLYGKESPEDRKNGKNIIIAAILIPIILIAIGLIIYNLYFAS